MKLISSKTKLLIDLIKWNEGKLKEGEGKEWKIREGLERMVELKLLEQPIILFGGIERYKHTKLYDEISNNYYNLIHN